jgi:hypothetical protein
MDGYMSRKKSSVFQKKYLPPLLEFLDENGIFANYDVTLLKQIFSDKGFIQEVQGIAYHTIMDHNYCDYDVNYKQYPGFNITLGGSLDILHPVMGCIHPECRKKEALNIARTVGLFANKLFIADHLSNYIANIDDPKHIDLYPAINDVLCS